MRPARLLADREPGHGRPLRRHPSQSERAAAGLPSTEEALSRAAHRADADPAIDENLASLDIKSIQTNLNALLVKLDTTVGQPAHGGHQSGRHQPARSPLTGSLLPRKSPTAWPPCGRPWTNTGCWARNSTAALIPWPTASPTRSPRPIVPWRQIRGAGENLRTMLAARFAVAQRPRPGSATTRRRGRVHFFTC